MEIERINDNTVKFYLSYVDIEERGYTREEVWNNREKSEELFWDMMDEVNESSDFQIEGPLWIQVHAKRNGIEVTVTRATSHDHEMTDLPLNIEDASKLFQDDDEEVFDNIEELIKNSIDSTPEKDWEENIFEFTDFEHLIQLASRVKHYAVDTKLYYYQETYYLHVRYHLDAMSNKDKANFISVLGEFIKTSYMTSHVLNEYGKVIMEDNVFDQIETYFA